MQLSLVPSHQGRQCEPPHRTLLRGGVMFCDFLPFLLYFVSSGNIAGERHGERRTRAEPVAPHGEGATMRFANRA